MELKSSMSSLSVLDVYGSMCDCLFDSNGVVGSDDVGVDHVFVSDVVFD